MITTKQFRLAVYTHLLLVWIGLTLPSLTSAYAQSHSQIIGPIRWPPYPLPVPYPWPRPALEQALQLESQSARVVIHGALARTVVSQTFQNTTDRTIEGTYVFPLPVGAALSGFAMTVNGKKVEAEILEGAKARDIYTGIVQKMRDPGILEFIDRNLIRAKIFPILPNAEQKVELSYSESLKPESGSFRYTLPLRLPTGGAARSASVDIQIDSPDGVRAVYSPTHALDVKRDGNTVHATGEWGEPTYHALQGDAATVPSRDGADRDFVLYYTVAKTRIGVNLVTYKLPGEDGYFMLLAAPDPALAAQEVAAKDVVFVCDTSGSMEGAKIEQARHALLTLLANLNPDDRFNIITFSSDTRTFHDALTPASRTNIAAARAWVGDVKAVGGTNINDALGEALGQLRVAPHPADATADRPQQIVFMTDGQPTVGETDNDQILKNVHDENLPHWIRNSFQLPAVRARIFVFGVGYDVNTQLLDSLAEDNGGSSDYVLPQEDIEQKVGSLYGKIAYPVLTNARLHWSGGSAYDVYPRQLPDLFRGGQVVVFGRYRGNSPGADSASDLHVRLVGTTEGRDGGAGGEATVGGDPGNDVLPRLWAMRKIGYLMGDARRNGRAVDQEVKDEIIKLAKNFGIVTPYTAALITDDEHPLPLPPDPQPYPYPEPRPMPMMRGGEDSVFQMGSTTGASGVAASKATNGMRDADRVSATEAPTLRYIAGKSFLLKEGVWTDTEFDAKKSPKISTIEFASPEYFALLSDARLAKWLSIGNHAIIVTGDRTIKIVPRRGP